MIGHVGTRVSALVDGQLPLAESERLWAHVHGCPTCRAEVEREGWVKTRVAGLALTGEQPAPPGHLAGSLRVTALGWPEPEAVVESHDRRRLVAAAIGVGSMGAAFLGVLAMTVPAQAPGIERRPATSLSRPSESSGSATDASATRMARSLLQGTTTSARLALTAAPESK
ncbi:MAG: zf-HC2 domain-containing protein [Nocardioides sp.]